MPQPYKLRLWYLAVVVGVMVVAAGDVPMRKEGVEELDVSYDGTVAESWTVAGAGAQAASACSSNHSQTIIVLPCEHLEAQLGWCLMHLQRTCDFPWQRRHPMFRRPMPFRETLPLGFASHVNIHQSWVSLLLHSFHFSP